MILIIKHNNELINTEEYRLKFYLKISDEISLKIIKNRGDVI